jgi:hypothetical protein
LNTLRSKKKLILFPVQYPVVKIETMCDHPAYEFFANRDCASCLPCFEEGKDECSACGFDMNIWNQEEEEEEKSDG